MKDLSAKWQGNPLEWAAAEARLGRRRVEDAVGGPARAKVIVLLACVLGMQTADQGATGALAAQLEAAFHIGNVKLGLLIAVVSLVGAVATLPFGVLTDRTTRVRLLAIAVSLWSVAEVASGLSTSYLMLLLIRIGLGVVTAAAAPVTASLIGDLFPAGERGRVYGWVLTGELIGTGLGLVLVGDLATILTWRGGLMVLGVPSAVLAWLLWRSLPEPARGGQSYLHPGAEEVPSEEEVAEHPDRYPPAVAADTSDRPEEQDEVLERVRELDVQPDPTNVIEGDPARMHLWEAVRWVLRVRTNVALILASALGYFFLGGVETFAVIFARGWYRVGQATASSILGLIGVGAVAGAIVVARVADRWVHRGRFDARMITGAAAYLLAAGVFVPALLSRSLLIALPLIVVAGFFLAGTNPPVDAARLDVIPSRMWGRAESIRTFLRQILQAFAPLVFGFVAGAFGGGGAGGGFGASVGSRNGHTHVSYAEAHGIQLAFLVMLLPLAAAGVTLLVSRRRYGVDVVTAGETEERTAEADAEQPADTDGGARREAG